MFASNGEKLDDFDVFHPDRMASRILGMGDVLTLIEQAEQAFDQEQADRVAEKLKTERGFTLEDFLAQMQAVRKMGSLSKILGMLPGLGEIRNQVDQLDDRELDRVEAIIRSMTPAERENPKLINGSRRLRIANGSGTKVNDVNLLVERFLEARKMMSQLSQGKGIPGMPGVPGMPGMGGGGGNRRPKKGKGKKQRSGRSGNPAKRSRQDSAAARERTEPEAVPPLLGGDFSDLARGPGQKDVEVPDGFELPKELRDMLGKDGA
jgi:signal recognition particle subunit SRP54